MTCLSQEPSSLASGSLTCETQNILYLLIISSDMKLYEYIVVPCAFTSEMTTWFPCLHFFVELAVLVLVSILLSQPVVVCSFV